MPQSLIGLKQIKSGEIGSYITGALGVGSTGSTSVTVYKDLFATGLATFSGNTFFKSGATFNQNVSFNSGAKFSGDITGYNNLVVSGKATVSGIGSFKNNVFLEQAATVSGAFTADGASVFNGTTSFQDPSTFDSSVILNSGISVGVATSVFSGDANLLGDNTFGTNAGSPTNNYFVGTSRFSGSSTFTTFVNISGATVIDNNFTLTGSDNSLIVSNGNDLIFTNGASGLLESGASFILNSSSTLSVLTGSSITLESGSNINIGGFANFESGSKSTFYSGSQVTGITKFGAIFLNASNNILFDPSGNLYPSSNGSVGIGTSTPSERLDVSGNLKVRQTGIFDTVSGNSYILSGKNLISQYTFQSSTLDLAASTSFATISYNVESSTPVLSCSIRATGDGVPYDLILPIISGTPTSSQATILFSSPIPITGAYKLDIIVASPTF